jgi:hypothetical protein
MSLKWLNETTGVELTTVFWRYPLKHAFSVKPTTAFFEQTGV